MRTIINFGAPLNIDGTRYNDLQDRKNEQRQHSRDFQQEIVKLIEEFKKDNKNGLDATIFSEDIGSAEF